MTGTRAFRSTDKAADLAQVTHNLCFTNKRQLSPRRRQLNVDPQFVDLVDFKLGRDLPCHRCRAAPDYALADLDRSRNDMGVYGGPWSIDQYDVQRDPYNLTPTSIRSSRAMRVTATGCSMSRPSAWCGCGDDLVGGHAFRAHTGMRNERE